MSDLAKKAINIKGKQYVLVKDRVLAFNEMYPNGSIITKMVRYDEKMFIFKAIVTPTVETPHRFFTGYSQAIHGSAGVNMTAALENAETSAVGRALAMLGIGVLDGIASADEMSKASYNSPTSRANTPRTNETASGVQSDGQDLLTAYAGKLHGVAYKRVKTKDGVTGIVPTIMDSKAPRYWGDMVEMLENDMKKAIADKKNAKEAASKLDDEFTAVVGIKHETAQAGDEPIDIDAIIDEIENEAKPVITKELIKK